MAITVERLVAEIEANPARAIAAFKTFEAAADTAARNRSSNFDVDTGGAYTELLTFESQMDVATRDRTVNIDVDRNGAAARSVGVLSSVMRGLSDALSGVARGVAGMVSGAGGGGGMSGLSTVMSSAASGAGALGKGLLGLAMNIGPMMVLITAIGSLLPGAFAAAAAGAGVLYAALAPLLGLVGLLVPLLAALGPLIGAVAAGFIPVMQGVGAYKDAMAGAAQATEDVTAKERALADARHGVVAAVRSVQQAEEALAKAREQLAKAPHEAAEAIEDAHFRAEQAIISEKQAILALEQAQKNLAQAQREGANAGMTLTKQTDEFTGKMYDVAYASADAVKGAKDEKEARLAVRQAELDLAMARDANSDAQRYLNEMEAKGIRNSDIMVAARDAVSDATWNLSESQRALAQSHQRVADAQKALNESVTQGTAAMQAWSEAQKNLSPAGVTFVKFIADEFMPAMSGISKAVQETMLPGIQDGLEALMTTFDEVENELAIVGGMIGDTFKDFWEFWAKPKQQKQLTNMFEELNEVIRSGLGMIRPMSRLLVGITDAAAPALARMLDTISAKLDEWADWFQKNDNEAQAFFDNAAHFGGLWLDVLKPIGGILSAISRALRPLAEKWLVSMADSLQETSDWLNSKPGQDSILDYVSSQVPTLKELWGVLSDIGEILFGVSKGGKESAFYKFLVALRDDLLPEVKEFFEVMEDSDFAAKIVTQLGDMLDGFNKVLRKLDQWTKSPIWKFMEENNFDPDKMLLGELKAELDFIQKKLEKWWDWWAGGWEEATTGAIEDLRRIKTFFTDLYDSAREKWIRFKEWWLNGWSDLTWGAWEDLLWLKDKIMGWVESIRGVLEAVTNWWDDLQDKVTAGDPSGNINKGFEGFGAPGVPKGEWSGGPVEKGKPYIVGEKRPELFVPTTSGRIMPKVEPSMIQSNGSGISDDQLERMLERVLERAKPDVKMENNFREKVDPQLLSRELAWSLS